MLARAVEFIRAAKCPMFAAGFGTPNRHASAALSSFAGRTGIPAGQTLAGKGLLRFDHARGFGAIGVWSIHCKDGEPEVAAADGRGWAGRDAFRLGIFCQLGKSVGHVSKAIPRLTRHPRRCRK